MLFLCGILSGACNKENEPDITPPSEGEQSNPVEMTFTFDVQTLSPNAAEISITPSDNTQTWYWTRATDKEFTDANKNKDALFKDMLESDIEYGIQEEGFDRAGAVADITHTDHSTTRSKVFSDRRPTICWPLRSTRRVTRFRKSPNTHSKARRLRYP